MTMVEAMVSVFILVFMSVMIASTMQNAIKFQKILEERDVTVRQARVTLGKLKREIAAAYLTPENMTSVLIRPEPAGEEGTDE